jgi:hypothetical protein
VDHGMLKHVLKIAEDTPFPTFLPSAQSQCPRHILFRPAYTHHAYNATGGNAAFPSASPNYWHIISCSRSSMRSFHSYFHHTIDRRSSDKVVTKNAISSMSWLKLP